MGIGIGGGNGDWPPLLFLFAAVSEVSRETQSLSSSWAGGRGCRAHSPPRGGHGPLRCLVLPVMERDFLRENRVHPFRAEFRQAPFCLSDGISILEPAA